MKALVVANWKMNPPTMREAKKLFSAARAAAEKSRAAVVVAPPSIFLRVLSESYRGSKVAFAVQNAHFEAGGAYTGETSFAQAKDARARYALIGHAERRAAGETDEDTGKKVAAAFGAGIVPVLCVGETKRSEGGEHLDIVRAQLAAGLRGVAPAKLKNVIVAYEPVWAIGASAAMEPRDMHQMSIFIRKCVVATHGEAGHAFPILYGGAVDETNAAAMLVEGDVRGFLVGRASVDAVRFSKLLASISRV